MKERLRQALTGPGPWLVALSLLIAAPTLTYVFGRDQAHHFYVARWWLEGAVPYRDSFHDKQPMLYLTHLLGIALGGVGPVGIRIVDVLATLTLGALVVVGVERGGRSPARGEIGAGMLLATASYFGTFDYWDTAHAEYWQAVWLLGAWALARRVPALPLAAALSGAASSIAVLYKPTAAVIAVGVAVALLARAWTDSPGGGPRALGIAAAVHVAGGLAPFLLFVAYFASQGALGDWYECTIVFPSAYANTPTPPDAARSLLEMFWLRTGSGWVLWFAFAWVAAMAVAWRERERAVVRAGAEAAGLFGLAVLTVMLQRKYYVYHWALAMPFLLQCAAFGVAALARRSPGFANALVLVASVHGVVQGPLWVSQYYASVPRPLTFRDYSVAYWSGRLPELRTPFRGPFKFDYADSQAVGGWIAERAQPGDTLVVGGFEPVIYTIADLRSPSRFQSEHVLTDYAEDFDQTEAWRREQEEAIERAPPDFVVTTWDRVEDERRRLQPQGYEAAYEHGPFVVLRQTKAKSSK